MLSLVQTALEDGHWLLRIILLHLYVPPLRPVIIEMALGVHEVVFLVVH